MLEILLLRSGMTTGLLIQENMIPVTLVPQAIHSLFRHLVMKMNRSCLSQRLLLLVLIFAWTGLHPILVHPLNAITLESSWSICAILQMDGCE